MKKIIEGVEELNSFLEPLLAGQYVVGAREIQPNKFEVQWEDRKMYTSFDGKEYPEEAWMTEDGQMIQIQDLSEPHAKNIIRMILRRRREADLLLAKLYEAAAAGEDETLGNVLENTNSKPILH